MGRLATIFGALMVLLLPLDATALWLDGQCSTGVDQEMWEDIADAVQQAEGAQDCDDDSTDPSSNACFEAAEHPISTLPGLIAQTQAEAMGADVVEDMLEAVVARAVAAEPSPDEASLEDPALPGAPLAERPPMPAPPSTPNSCTAAHAPDQCHSAPTIPNLNLEASVAQGAHSRFDAEIPPAPDHGARSGPSNPGLGPASGVSARVERPPQIT